MDEEVGVKTFPSAPMTPSIRVLTLLLLALPVALLVGAYLWERLLAVPAAFVVVVYAWVWPSGLLSGGQARGVRS